MCLRLMKGWPTQLVFVPFHMKALGHLISLQLFRLTKQFCNVLHCAVNHCNGFHTYSAQNTVCLWENNLSLELIWANVLYQYLT